MQLLRRPGSLALALAGTALAPPVSAETLMEALTRAYLTNPILTSARADQRANDENVPLAKAQGRPSAGVNGSYNELIERGALVTSTPGRSVSAQGSVTVPVYSGGTVRNAVNAARARVAAGQHDLRGTESAVFSQVVAAYMDVIRDSTIVTLNEQNVRALDVNLQATRDRFEVGDLTRTDVAQSESRLALARTDLQLAEARLIASKENYTALVGSPPGDLQPPPALPGLPPSPDAAVSTALTNNPDIQAALKAQDAARYDVRATKGQVMPRVSGFVDGSYSDYLGSENPAFVPNGSAKQAAVGATLSIPLYQGGGPAAAERQAAARQSAATERTIAIQRDVIAQVRAAYARWRASAQSIESTTKAVEAAELSLRGVRAENTVGTRTILDILDAEREMLNARVQLVSARRDAYVAAFTMLAAMGRAEARDLGLDPSILYDPQRNYERVRGKFLDFDFDPQAPAVATPTTDTPSQDATPLSIPGY